MIPLPSKKYSIIYADPPWLYNHNDLPETGLQAKYKTEKSKSSSQPTFKILTLGRLQSVLTGFNSRCDKTYIN
jgi:hypothetical protein